MVKVLSPGVYAPLPTFFFEDGEVDWESYRVHLLKVTQHGIIPLCLGSLGEAVHLSPDERIAVVRFVRKTLDENDMLDKPIVAGIGGQSLRETVSLANDAHQAGADAGMVILPAYYAQALSQDSAQVIEYYIDVCKASPLPILLYNFPANSGGQDMSSSVIESIMTRSPNLCGVKLTCGGSMGKLIRLKNLLDTRPELNQMRRYPFLLVDGLIGDLTPWMGVGGHGTTSGIPNFAPAASARLYRLLKQDSLSEEEAYEARRIQAILSNADADAVPGGIRAMKHVLSQLHGYSVWPRRPLLPLKLSDGEMYMELFADMIALESEYAS